MPFQAAGTPGPPPAGPGGSPRGRGILDSTKHAIDDILGRVTEDKIQIDLTGDDYTKVDEKQAARMLGFFTQKLQNIGFPWHLYKADLADDGQLKMSRSPLSELEALDEIKAGNPVFLQPMRNLQLDLTGDSLGALAAAGSLGGGTALDPVGKVATFSKTAKLGGNQGIELKFGTPVPISSYSELKLLYQMYNPEEKLPENPSATAKAAHQLSYFTTKTMGTQHPWRFYKKAEDSAILRVARAALKSGASGAAVGLAVGAVIGGPIGLFTGNWSVMKILATYGAMIGGGYAALDAGRVAAKGQPINVVEALERVTQGKDVVFQETRMRSINVPILGSVAWFSDHGKGSTINSMERLDKFYWMQDQDAKEEEKKKEEPGAKPGATVIVMPGGTVHLQVGDKVALEDHVHHDQHHDVHMDSHYHLKD